jgi:signal transduction histidine kinase
MNGSQLEVPRTDLFSRGDILLVDDASNYLRFLSTRLAERGYKARGVTSGQMALTVARAALPDVIVLDVKMPEMDGYEVCQHLKADARTREIPVIFLTILDDVPDKVKAFALGGVDYLTKPFEIEELIARIENQLTIRHLQRRLQVQTQQLQQLNVLLQQEIRNRDRVLNQLQQAETNLREALEREKELNQLKSRFVSMVSHEFRTPLGTIQSAVELLEHYDWTPEEREERFHQIYTAVQHMTRLLEDILLIGRADAGRVNFHPTLLDLNQFCSDLVSEIKQTLGAQHNLNFVSRCSHPQGYLDKQLLRQIFTNLLSNAVKYSPLGSTVLFELTCEDGQVIFQVTDEGIGIPLEDQPRIFEFFHRAVNVGGIPGTGLGLSIVKRWVDYLDGTITFRSEVGSGTAFKVTLPFANSTDSKPLAI